MPSIEEKKDENYREERKQAAFLPVADRSSFFQAWLAILK
jgi:hypothetical protein